MPCRVDPQTSTGSFGARRVDVWVFPVMGSHPGGVSTTIEGDAMYIGLGTLILVLIILILIF